MIQWSLKTFPIKSLKKYHKNPRILTKDKYNHLKQSIDKFGLIDKPILNTDLTIIGGHQRIEVLKKKGIDSVDCWFPDRELTESEIEECNLRMNKNSGEWDWNILANDFGIQDLITWGFTPDELVGAVEEIDTDSPKKDKKEKLCPNCGEKL